VGADGLAGKHPGLAVVLVKLLCEGLPHRLPVLRDDPTHEGGWDDGLPPRLLVPGTRAERFPVRQQGDGPAVLRVEASED
jgi:hypothetical protein